MGGISNNLVSSGEGKRKKSPKKVKSKRPKSHTGYTDTGEGEEVDVIYKKEGGERKRKTLLKKMKTRRAKKSDSLIDEVDREEGNNVDVLDKKEGGEGKRTKSPKKMKLKKMKLKRRKKNDTLVGEADIGESEEGDIFNKQETGEGKMKKSSKKMKSKRQKKDDSLIAEVDMPQGEDGGIISKKDGKFKKQRNQKSKERSTEKGNNLVEKRGETEQDEVYNISAVNEDCTKGMKKWIMQYHQSRPGLQILQQRIDDFITAHEARLEEERRERKARSEEDGWTVVEHHKGRKKTTDAESGITVGSVAQVAVADKLAKKKRKDVGLEFYRFQKKEARRNEILALQTKFEQDKKRIEQLRAARKFRPY